MEQAIPKKNLLVFWFIIIIWYLFVCTSAAFYAAKVKRNTQASIKQIRAEQIKRLLRERNIQEFTYNQADIYYTQSGSINPSFKNIVSKKAPIKQAPKTRAYEQQLAEYKRIMAQQEKARREAELRAAEQAARERALMEQDRAERLKQEQEMQRLMAIQTANKVAPVKTEVQKKPEPPETEVEQKTQIGVLKTSKLGESTFQKQKFYV